MATDVKILEGDFSTRHRCVLRDGTLHVTTLDGKRVEISLTALEPIDEATISDDPNTVRTTKHARGKRTFVAQLNDGSERWFRARMFRDEFAAEIIPVVGWKDRPTGPPPEDDEEEIL